MGLGELWEGVAGLEEGQAALLCCSSVVGNGGWVLERGTGQCCCGDCTEHLWFFYGGESHLGCGFGGETSGYGLWTREVHFKSV